MLVKGKLWQGVGAGSYGEAAASLQCSEEQLGCEPAQGCLQYTGRRAGPEVGLAAGLLVLTASHLPSRSNNSHHGNMCLPPQALNVL